MFRQKVTAAADALARQARSAGASATVALGFLSANIGAGLGSIWRTSVWAFRGIFIPVAASPFEVLKHYLTVLFIGMGLLALVWAAWMVVSPPLVITVMDLPSQLKNESWINPELPRTLINEIDRLRALVKGDRQPAFEAVLNPPNVVIKASEFSLNVQEQILTPLGSLLGFGQGEVRLALTCFHPTCLRTKDSDCNNVISDPKTLTPSDKQYLCLRLTADIQRGRAWRRLTSLLVLTNETYQLELTKQMSRIAEAVTSVADPATAALYFYRRVQEEGAATRSFRSDPEVITELRGEAFRAAELAENDVVSECWGHAVRAHLALIRREFKLADVYIERARSIPPLKNLMKAKSPNECQRLIAIAQMEFARRLARPAALAVNTPFAEQTDNPAGIDDEGGGTADADGKNETRPGSYPEYPDDADDKRVMAANNLIAQATERYRNNTIRLNLFGYSLDDDLMDALTLARSEVGLGWFTSRDQCRLISGDAVPVELEPDLQTGTARELPEGNPPVDESFVRTRIESWRAIQASLKKLKTPSTESYGPLTREAAIGLFEKLAANQECIESIQSMAEQFFLNHPHDPKVAQLFGLVTEEAAMNVTRKLTREARPTEWGNPMLQRARGIYARMVDIGDDKSDVFALARLAIITEAFLADQGNQTEKEKDKDKPKKFGPNADTLLTITRAWRRYQQQLYPTAARHHAEQIVTFWGSLLLRFYPTLTAVDLSSESAKPDKVTAEEMHLAMKQFADFQRAWQVLFPAAPIKKLADLPQMDGIGTRIGCLCMLSYVIYENELADFLVANVNKWQRRVVARNDCKSDMIPTFNVPLRIVRRNVVTLRRVSATAKELEAAAEPKPPELEQQLKEETEEDQRARVQWMRYAVPRRTVADSAAATRQRKALQAAMRAAGNDAPPELSAGSVIAVAVEEKAQGAVKSAQEDAESARQSMPKKYSTLDDAEAACFAPSAPAPVSAIRERVGMERSR